jgi:formate dehydrogenase gamma subunit
MSEERTYLRFTVSDRIEHWVQMLSFTTLALTGLVQKFATNPVSLGIISLLGGVEAVRIIHRVAAVVLMIGVVYHFGSVGYKLYVRRVRPSMLPTIGDVRAALGVFLYNLGQREQKPQQGRYTFDEKFEYWAFAWGTIVMAVTGFMLWNPIATTKFLSGEFIPAAKAAHGGEALLAVLAIIIWHFYNVHIKHLNKSMFTGKLTEEEMLEEHPLELADIKAGIAERPLDPEKTTQRRRIFLPVYAASALVMLTGIYFFVTFEETAITTLPPAERVGIFVPLTPTPLPTHLPTSTPPPLAGRSWEAGIADLLAGRCGICHGQTVLGGLNLSTYQSALQGGESGPAIVPGDLETSLLMSVQSAGDHEGQLSEEELELVGEWIAAGAPEQ